MQTQRRVPPRRISSAVVTALVAFAALTGCAQVTGAPAAPDRAAEAWTDRLNGQAQAAAEHAQEDTAQLARLRANDAYAARLTAQARSGQSDASRDRANQAWTDRLNALAEHVAADR